MRLIDADAAIEAINALREKHTEGKILHDQSVCAGISETMRIIEQAKTIDAAPVVHARWVRAGRDKSVIVCNTCSVVSDQEYPYCSHCGAKMYPDEWYGSPVGCIGCDNNVEGFCPADCLCPDTDRWLLALREEVWRLRAELDKAREALKGAQVICETATSEKKKAEAERDAWRRRAECLESRLASMTSESLCS